VVIARSSGAAGQRQRRCHIGQGAAAGQGRKGDAAQEGPPSGGGGFDVLQQH